MSRTDSPLSTASAPRSSSSSTRGPSPFERCSRVKPCSSPSIEFSYHSTTWGRLISTRPPSALSTPGPTGVCCSPRPIWLNERWKRIGPPGTERSATPMPSGPKYVRRPCARFGACNLPSARVAWYSASAIALLMRLHQGRITPSGNSISPLFNAAGCCASSAEAPST